MRALRQLWRNARGVSAVEFALAVPVLVLLYLGTYQISDAVSCARKVTITTRAVADLTSQYQSVTSQVVSNILNASAQILYPFSSSNAVITVSEIYTDNNGATTVVWSQSANGTPRVAGTTFPAPASVVTKGAYLIVSEVRYAYAPAVTFGVVGPLTLGDTIYMSPRLSPSIPLS